MKQGENLNAAVVKWCNLKCAKTEWLSLNAERGDTWKQADVQTNQNHDSVIFSIYTLRRWDTGPGGKMGNWQGQRNRLYPAKQDQDQHHIIC